MSTAHSFMDVRIHDAYDFAKVIAKTAFAMEARLLSSNNDDHVHHLYVPAGCVSVTRFEYFGALQVSASRKWAHIREDNAQTYLFWFPLTGGVTVGQNNHSAVAFSGEVVIGCSKAPYRTEALHDQHGQHLSYLVTAPTHVVRDMIPDVDMLLGTSFALDGDAGAMALSTIVETVERSDALSQDLRQAFLLAALLATTQEVARARNPQPCVVGKRTRRAEEILTYIDKHICDPDLSIDKVAAAANISSSYVYALLRDQGIGFHKYVWDQRFARAYDRIRDPRFASETIASIAFMEGFNSSAHFSRAFRQRFGISPSEARKVVSQGDAVPSAVANC